MLKVVLSLGLALCTVSGAFAQAPESPNEVVQRKNRELLDKFQSFMEDCIVIRVNELDDHISPANVVADGLMDSCWRGGGSDLFRNLMENGKVPISQVSAERELNFRIFRTIALPTVLKARVARLQSKG